MTELKPCPFCGENNAEFKHNLKHGTKYIRCITEECFCRTGYKDSEGEAILAWNIRPIEYTLSRELQIMMLDRDACAKQRDALQAKLDVAVKVLEEIATYPAVLTTDWTITIHDLKGCAREALKKLET